MDTSPLKQLTTTQQSVKTFKANIHGRSVRIIGFPHFSYYSPEGKEQMISWVKAQMAS